MVAYWQKKLMIFFNNFSTVSCFNLWFTHLLLRYDRWTDMVGYYSVGIKCLIHAEVKCVNDSQAADMVVLRQNPWFEIMSCTLDDMEV